MSKSRLLASLAASLLCLLTACGGGGHSSPSVDTTPSPATIEQAKIFTTGQVSGLYYIVPSK